ncbi:hypothetical protein [Pseudomonas sp.]|uniref:hypothetical protein n=1 Tax=Pseudomonas sp. TaxID=306 RepID=UPI003A97D868
MIYSTSSNSALGTRFLRWAPTVVLSAACCTLISHHMALSKLAQRLVEQADSTELQYLEDRVMGLEQSILNTQPDRNTATRTELSDLYAQLSGRITDIEHLVISIGPQTDWQALGQRVQQIESRQKQLAQSSIPSKHTSSARKPKKLLEPPFQVFGRELRGGERFLSIGPVGSRSLDQSRLIRIGESYSGWRFEGFDDLFAVFVADGVTHRLNIP